MTHSLAQTIRYAQRERAQRDSTNRGREAGAMLFEGAAMLMPSTARRSPSPRRRSPSYVSMAIVVFYLFCAAAIFADPIGSTSGILSIASP